MENVFTMSLSDSDSSMTPLFPSAKKQQEPTSSSSSSSLVYKPEVDIPPPPQQQQTEKNTHEKNISKSKAMDSTPLSDIMMGGGGDEYVGAGAAGGGPDPRFMMAPQPSYVQQQMPTPMGNQQQKQQQHGAQSKNPMNLTDEQMEALLAGIVGLLAFSGMAQEKLSTIVPKFLDETGKRSTVGSVVLALLAAVLFYFGRRFVIKTD
jgi:hypothetical protein